MQRCRWCRPRRPCAPWMQILPSSSIRRPSREEYGCEYRSQLHALQFAVERLALDAENLRGLALVAPGSGEHLTDLIFLGVGERFHWLVARFHCGKRAVDG